VVVLAEVGVGGVVGVVVVSMLMEVSISKGAG
jgi:hypothetical protein